MEVRQAELTLRSAKRKLANAQRELELAQKTFKMASELYDAGVADSLEMVDSHTALYMAELNAAREKLDYNYSILNLQLATGQFSPLDLSN